MRKIREELKQKEKQDQKQKMIDAGIALLKQMKDKEVQILTKQVSF